jgi:DNA topoisomerase-1
MTIKKSRNGNFIGCDGFPDCTCAYPLPRGAMIQTLDSKCEVCGLPQLKVISKGVPPQTVCIDPKCESNTSVSNLGTCPKCGKGNIRVMYSKTGKRFAGCSSWPSCDQTYPLRPKGLVSPTGKKCPDCGAPIIKTGTYEECINNLCPSRKR